MSSRSLLVVVVLSACSDPPTDAPPLPATLAIAASAGTIANTFQATISGTGSDATLGAVDIEADVGAMTLAGEPGATALYGSEPFVGYQIFEAVVVAPDRWSFAYPYCMGSELVDVYAEAVGSGGFVLSPAGGSCASTATVTDTAVDLPAVTIPAPAAFGDATVQGAQIELDHGAGQIAIDGAMLPAVVFNTVDCSTGCGSPGWYELHTLIWDPASNAATFVILYLTLGTPDQVSTSYGLRLPTLDDPFGDEAIDATWTAPTARAPAAAPPLHLPPPWQATRQ